MYRFYVVPDATGLGSHSSVYVNEELFWDPYAESDAYAIMEPVLKSEINKASSFEFTILPTNVHYNDFYKRKSVVVGYDDDGRIFEGYVSSNAVDFYKQRRVTCTSTIAYLCDSIQPPDKKNKIEIPTSSSETKYLPVTSTQLNGSNPKAKGWFEQEIDDESIKYKATKDTSPNADKEYFYAITSDGKNHSNIVVKTKKATKETIKKHLERLIELHNAQVNKFKQFKLGTVDADNEEHEFDSSNHRNTWECIENDILENFGKYLTVTVDANNELNINYVKLDTSTSSMPKIEYTKNMLSMNETDEKDDELFTVLIPTGDDELTLSDAVTGHDKPSGEGDGKIDPYLIKRGGEKKYVVVSDEALRKYGYIVKTQSFSGIKDRNKLYDRAVEYIKNNYDDHVEYEVKAVDLKLLGLASTRKITVGMKCRVKSTWHEVDSTDMYVISAEWNLVNPENDTFKIGMPTQDRDAKNKTITGQLDKSRSKSRSAAASASSGISSTASKLDEYIKATEWGLEIHSRLVNDVESEDQMSRTRFEQDEYHMRMTAQKIFGEDDQDVKYVAIPSSEYAHKNPNEMHWYELKNGKYVLTEDKTPVDGKTYYVQRLWTRVSDIDVGQGGIHARVDGNTKIATACSSWIDANEDALLALTGHLHVNAEGEVVVDSGAGFRTGHKETVTGKKYMKVPRSWYETKYPNAEHWYVRKYDSSGKWYGQDQADSETNDVYYELTSDSKAQYNTIYYYKNTVKEEFVSEFGVYDENNLTAGVIVRSINYPDFVQISDAVKRAGLKEGISPNAEGWYVYNEETQTFDLSLDNKVSMSRKYYTRNDNMKNIPAIKGEHVIIGYTDDYQGMDPKVKARVDNYLYSKVPDEMLKDANPEAQGWYVKNPAGQFVLTTDSAVDPETQYYMFGRLTKGTITEIASDVVAVNALFARFISFDDAEGDTIHVEFGNYHDLTVSNDFVVADDDDDGTSTMIKGGEINTRSINSDELWGDVLGVGPITFSQNPEYKGIDPGDIVVGFGAVTTSGDTVTIPYLTAEDDGVQNANKKLSFNKPASLGSVTWSSGNYLKALTVGGVEFLSGRIGNYVPSGQSEAQQMINARYLDGETSGYDQVYGLYYNTVGVNGSTISHKTMLFRTPKDRYDDGRDAGWQEAAEQIDWPTAMQGNGERTSFDISYPKSKYGNTSTTTLTLRDSDPKGESGFVRVYRDFKSSSNPGTLIGAIQVGDWYTNGYSDAISTVRVQSDSGKGNNETIELGYGGSATVRSQYKKLGESTYTNDEKITITAPSKGSYRTYMNRNGDVTDSSTAIEIGYGESVTVKAQRKLDGDSNWTSATGITIKAPKDNETTISSDDISPYINATSYRFSQSQPTSGTHATQLESNIKAAANTHQYLSFYVNATVSVGQTTVTSGPVTYYCDLTSGFNPS